MKRLFSTVSYLCWLALPGSAAAQSCAKLPTCTELGYTTLERNCPTEVKALTCPFDNTKVYCPEDCNVFTLSSCDETKGVCESCGNGNNWKYESCKPGWHLSGYDCVENECPDYPYTTEPSSEAGTVISCKRGAEATKYGYSSCNPGWYLSDYDCVENDCTYYPYTTEPDSEIGRVVSCQSGTTTKYGYSACKNGWVVNNGYCDENSCSAYGSASETICACKTTSSCLKGSDTVYKCDQCIGGYDLTDNGLCETKYTTGDVYYYNDTLIGLVFATCDAAGVLALNNIDSNGQEDNSAALYWSTSEDNDNYAYDVDTLPNSSSIDRINDGKGNTQKILAYVAANGYEAQAATATSLYAPSVCPEDSFCGKGQWYLPSYTELNQIGKNNSKLKNVFSSVGGTPLSSYYWTSSESNDYNAWTIYTSGLSGSGHAVAKSSRYPVRPILYLNNGESSQ